MNICYCKAFVAFLLSSMVLIACNPAQTGHVITHTETINATPSPTTLPYWDLLLVDWDPDGGWTTLVLEESDIACQDPGGGDPFQATMKAELSTIQSSVDEIAKRVIAGMQAVLEMESPYPPEYQEAAYRAARFYPGSGFDQLLTADQLAEIIQ